MRVPEQVSIVQFGATGPVAEIFRETVGHERSPFRLEAIVPASGEDMVGLTWGATGLCNQPVHEQVPVISIQDGIHNTDANLVFSSVRADVASLYEDQFAEGRLLATNASPNRMRRDVALLNAYFNPQQLDELYQQDGASRIIANGNCMSIIVSLAMSPIHKEFGIQSASIETLQGWSGAGKAEVPTGKERDVEPIQGDEAEKIETEPNKFLGSIALNENIAIRAKPVRAPWVRGHQAQIVMKLGESVKIDEIRSVLDSFRAPQELHSLDYGPNSPRKKPIKVVKKRLTTPSNRNFIKLTREVKPMRIRAHVVCVSGEENNIVTIEVAGDNLVLGAAGSSVMNLAYAKQGGYLE